MTKGRSRIMFDLSDPEHAKSKEIRPRILDIILLITLELSNSKLLLSFVLDSS